ncbi:uncharacterized protein LOC128342564 isoform X1 [Hemicordylus capensis]|uniref:uncharacterized protein LOC128342564 isoform X1 n=1 Tax=Hemicordylus capensis TaxID=884348 RepID=UPI0023020796|nr:uncharacterized protein LOC128342564 isoform X1 [Hemicordylus capensis]
MLQSAPLSMGLLKRKSKGENPANRSKSHPVAGSKKTVQGSCRSTFGFGNDEANTKNYEKIREDKITSLWDTIYSEVQTNISSVDKLYHIYNKAYMAISHQKETLDDQSCDSKEVYVERLVKEMEKSYLKPEAIYIHIAGMMTSYTLSKLHPPISPETEGSLIRQSIRGMAACYLGRGDICSKDLQENATEILTMMVCSLLSEKPSTVHVLHILGYFNICIQSICETMQSMAMQICIPLLRYASYLRDVDMQEVRSKIPPSLYTAWTSLRGQCQEGVAADRASEDM